MNEQNLLSRKETSPRTTSQELFAKVQELHVNLLEMFCQQGPPTKRWIETKGQFWEGWNAALKKVEEILKPSDLDKIPPWLVFVGDYPYCREHGALLCVNKETTIWRCSICHRGIEYEKVVP